MGGKVLDYEAKTIKREGIQQSIEQGEDKLAKLMENELLQDVIRVIQDKINSTEISYIKNILSANSVT